MGIKANQIKFWPNILFNKMDDDYENVGYTSTLDYHDFIQKTYFEKEDWTELPQNIPPTSWEKSENDNLIVVNIDVAKYEKVYGKNFDWKNTNWFLSNFNNFAPTKIDRSYWFVINTNITYDQKTGDIMRVQYALKLDEWSTFYDLFWMYKGVLEVERLSNNRFIYDGENGIFGTKQYIPDLSFNEFIRNCDDYCTQINQKTQYEKSQVLLSSKYFGMDGTYKNGLDTKFDENGKLTKNYEYVVYLWVQEFSGENKPKVHWSNLSGGSVPYQCYVVLAPKNEMGVTLQAFYDNYIKENFKVVSSNVSELLFSEDSLEQKWNEGDKYIFLAKDSVAYQQENLILQDYNNTFLKMFFYTSSQITDSPIVDWKNEPHIFTGNHTSIHIGSYNRQPIEFDASNLFIKNSNYKKVEINLGAKTVKLMERKSVIAPNGTTINQYLLDNDTSIAMKKSTNTLNHLVEGNLEHPWAEDTYAEWMKTEMAQKSAGLNMIDKQEQDKMNQAGWSLGQAGVNSAGSLGNAATSFLGGNPVKGVQNVIGSITGLINGGLEFGKQKQSAKLMADAQRQSFNAKYEDAKKQPANIKMGQPSQLGGAINFSQFDDDENLQMLRKLHTPTLSILQIKDYEAQNVAIHINKFGYQQKRNVAIKSLNDVMYRKFWNVLQVTNALEISLATGINPQLTFNFLERLTRTVRFHNLENIDYNDLFNWNKNNYEKYFDSAIIKLEGLIYGD